MAIELQTGTYRHGPYSHMIVNDNKRRDIAVASVRDRIVHRLLYDYLVPIYDKTFIYDAWSCRRDKGLHGAIDRTQLFMRKYPDVWLWRADITKLFDSIDKETMKQLLKRRVGDPLAQWLIGEVIDSYRSFDDCRGIPIGNLTSQILANIYLHELDRFMSHVMKPRAYLRYGDDWLCFADDRVGLQNIRAETTDFLFRKLALTVNSNVDAIKMVKKGVSYLGVDLWSGGRRLDRAAKSKMTTRLNMQNVSSYKSLLAYHQSVKHIKKLDWKILQQIDA